jgi:hypothetical protein
LARPLIEREKNIENFNTYPSTDQGRNPIWSLNHYITAFVTNHNFVKKEEKEAEWDARFNNISIYNYRNIFFFYPKKFKIIIIYLLTRQKFLAQIIMQIGVTF